MNNTKVINIDKYFDQKHLQILNEVSEIAHISGFKIYLVGGVVRDIIFKEQYLDTDILVEGDALLFVDKIKNHLPNVEVIKQQNDLHTATLVFNGEIEIDFASTRKESYPQKGFLPHIDQIGCSIEEDSKRRDFTVNTLLISLNKEDKYALSDFHNALKVGNFSYLNMRFNILHKDSFIDDPSRILRLVKFLSRFSYDLDINEETWDAFENYLKNPLRNIPVARIKSEFIDIFNHAYVPAMYFLKTETYKVIADQINKPRKVLFFDPYVKAAKLIKKYANDSKYIWLIYFLIFFYGENMPDFDFDNQEKKIIEGVDILFETEDEKHLYKSLSKISTESVIVYAFLKNDNKIFKKLQKLSEIKIYTTGDDLISMGFKPSSLFKEIFDRILDEKLKSYLKTKEEEENFIKSNF